jgi:hypothetical protein
MRAQIFFLAMTVFVLPAVAREPAEVFETATFAYG